MGTGTQRTKYALKIWVKTPLTSPMSNMKESVHVLAKIRLGMEESKISKSHLDKKQSAQTNSFLSFR